MKPVFIGFLARLLARKAPEAQDSEPARPDACGMSGVDYLEVPLRSLTDKERLERLEFALFGRENW